MPRYFLEVAYKGTGYSGFQIQKNANSIQQEIEKGFGILLQKNIELTGSSRTDAGVHALQNFFHFDCEELFLTERGIADSRQLIYKLNAILPVDIVVNDLFPVGENVHCRFDALYRDYAYFIYHKKDPFLRDRAYYFPYKVDIAAMQEAAALLQSYSDFTSFSKRNTQVKTFECNIIRSEWEREGEQLVYRVRANRFLRGMVRALTATMLQVGRGNLSVASFESIVKAKDCTLASFAVPPHGLFLTYVAYPDDVNNGR